MLLLPRALRVASISRFVVSCFTRYVCLVCYICLQLCLVTMGLFKTLIELNCEDVMFHLIFKSAFLSFPIISQVSRLLLLFVLLSQVSVTLHARHAESASRRQGVRHVRQDSREALQLATEVLQELQHASQSCPELAVAVARCCRCNFAEIFEVSTPACIVFPNNYLLRPWT